MLYLIIPPIIIIVGLALLVYFLFRKASQSPVSAAAVKENKRPGRILKFILTKISQFALRLMEKITKWGRLYSLKLHNLSQRWFQSIRNKREKIKIRKEKEIEKTEEKTSKKIAAAEIKPPEKTAISRPMVSREAVRPEAKIEFRNKLEEALIERIAANPADIEAYERLGDYYAEKGSYEDALECFRQVLKLSPVHRKARIKAAKLEKLVTK